MNTAFDFTYRDASNYKMHNVQVFKGELTEAQISEIYSLLFDGESFIPEQVGMDVERFDDVTDEDTCLCEMNEIAPTTALATDPSLTAYDVYCNFVETNGEWDFMTYDLQCARY